MKSLPLLAHSSPDAVIAWRGGAPISARQFVADARALAAQLPATRHVLNACSDRYRFAVGFAACLITGRTSLLPPSLVPEVIRQLKHFAADAVCLTDDAASSIDLPRIQFPALPAAPEARWEPPSIPGDLCAACVFTSGSTGVPVAHAKRWAPLMADVAVEAELLDLLTAAPRAIVATVPPQHMYGFESSLLLALHSGQAFCAERPFFPAEVAATLAAVPRGRLLVSTPVHLRALVAAKITLPPLEAVVCATAPLDASLALEAERSLAAPLFEIYGSTETGQIAHRRTATEREWNLWPGVSLSQHEGRTWAQGGHVGAALPLGDVVEILSPESFLLRGRTEDLINIAGKRSSIAYLNHQLLEIPGVLDGVFYLPRAPEGHATTGTERLAALVVAPGMTAAEIMRVLRERIDAAFLPRPLQLVESIPRNATGKLPWASLRSLTGAMG
jgi:acyl-coenzyme A synthetase/AMP-(fatty) acid ligase